MPQHTVTLNEDLSRYELFLDTELAGFIDIKRSAAGWAFVHTEVPEGFQGQGVAGILARGALEDAAGRGEAVIPLCPFIARFLERNAISGLTVHWPQSVKP